MDFVLFLLCSCKWIKCGEREREKKNYLKNCITHWHSHEWEMRFCQRYYIIYSLRISCCGNESNQTKTNKKSTYRLCAYIWYVEGQSYQSNGTSSSNNNNEQRDNQHDQHAAHNNIARNQMWPEQYANVIQTKISTSAQYNKLEWLLLLLLLSVFLKIHFVLVIGVLTANNLN